MSGSKPKHRKALGGAEPPCTYVEQYVESSKMTKPKREGALSKAERNSQPGLVRGIPAGWGALR
jgi:hypothetical protein